MGSPTPGHHLRCAAPQAVETLLCRWPLPPSGFLRGVSLAVVSSRSWAEDPAISESHYTAGAPCVQKKPTKMRVIGVRQDCGKAGAWSTGGTRKRNDPPEPRRIERISPSRKTRPTGTVKQVRPRYPSRLPLFVVRSVQSIGGRVLHACHAERIAGCHGRAWKRSAGAKWNSSTESTCTSRVLSTCGKCTSCSISANPSSTSVSWRRTIRPVSW
jgi:hypothetical protein